MRHPEFYAMLPHTMTLSDLMVQARENGTIASQHGNMDGQPAIILAAVGDNAKRLLRYLKRNYDNGKQVKLP